MRERSSVRRSRSTAQLLRAHLVVDHRAHLGEGEAEVLERDDPVEPGELRGLVRAVAGGRVHVRGPEQADRVVVPQHPDRHAAVAGEVSDSEHDSPGLGPDTMSGSSRVRLPAPPQPAAALDDPGGRGGQPEREQQSLPGRCSNAAPPITPSPTLYALQIVTPTTSASAYVRQGNSVVPAVSATAVRPPGTNRATTISVRPRRSSAF